MSKRLQVVIKDSELQAIRRVAQAHGMTVSEWVRQTLRDARREAAGGDPDKRLAVVRAAVRHEYPTAEIDEMLEQIESGYAGADS